MLEIQVGNHLRHKISGKEIRVIAIGRMEHTLEEAVVFTEGYNVWIKPLHEFTTSIYAHVN